MPDVMKGRFSAYTDEPFVVFLIGIRINKLLAIRKWWPVFASMPPMLQELATHPEKGYINGRLYWSGRVVLLVQYWRSFAQLEAFARDTTDLHLPAWRHFNQTVAKSGIVGVFHETYTIQPGQFESVYSDMPVFGLAGAMQHVPATGKRETARDRLSALGEDTP